MASNDNKNYSIYISGVGGQGIIKTSVIIGEAAMLEGKISSPKTVNDELNRLYNIMLVNSDNKEIVTIVYKDFLEVLKNSNIEEDRDNYINLVDGINAYLQNNAEFPFLTDYQ